MSHKKKAKLPTSYPAPVVDKAQEAKWRAEDDLRTLQRAAEVKADKTRMKAAKACANQQMQALKKIDV